MPQRLQLHHPVGLWPNLPLNHAHVNTRVYMHTHTRAHVHVSTYVFPNGLRKLQFHKCPLQLYHLPGLLSNEPIHFDTCPSYVCMSHVFKIFENYPLSYENFFSPSLSENLLQKFCSFQYLLRLQAAFCVDSSSAGIYFLLCQENISGLFLWRLPCDSAQGEVSSPYTHWCIQQAHTPVCTHTCTQTGLLSSCSYSKNASTISKNKWQSWDLASIMKCLLAIVPVKNYLRMLTTNVNDKNVGFHYTIQSACIYSNIFS